MMGQAAQHPNTGESEETQPWPRGVSRRPVHSIGNVVSQIQREFPAITVSKIRFLEDQGLVTPARTGAGYRKYSDADVERIRFVLTQQRDTFAPLRVIGQQLKALDAGHTIEPTATARIVASDGHVVVPDGRDDVSTATLADLTGTDIETLERFTAVGLIHPDLGGYFPIRTIQVVGILRLLEDQGVDVRTLRSVRTGADRSADIIDQTVSSTRSRSRALDQEKAASRANDLAELFADLHREMLRVSLARLNGPVTKP